CSLASHAFEHPADPFPEFTDDGPSIDAEGVGHPLLPEDKVVRNDVQMGGALRLLVVSGSNMSGKSTLLRTLGVNTVLAQAGAPARGLVERGAIGLITTHDLALADVADELGERARNVHFEDHIEDGQIRFDYVMRPGVVRKSNAIELMRQVGLEI